MDIKKVFESRRSVRRYTSEDVNDKDIEEILHCASLAPTARNVQPWEFLVVKDKKSIQDISKLASPNGSFIAGAPVCIAIFCLDTKYYLEDGCAATTQALLSAVSLGLGACWVAGDKKDYCDAIKERFNVPRQFKLVSLISLGHPAETPRVEKRDAEMMLHRESF